MKRIDSSAMRVDAKGGGRLRTWARTGAVSIVAAVLAGCAIYSPTRDKQGQAAQAAWGKVDLKQQVEVPRQNLARMLDEQLAVEEEIWSTRRGHLAGMMAGSWSVDRLNAELDKSLARVVGGTTPDDALQRADALARQAQQQETAEKGVAAAAANIRMIGTAAPSCEIARNAPAFDAFNQRAIDALGNDAQRALYAGSANSLRTACDALAQTRVLKNSDDPAKASPLPLGGELGAALLTLDAEEAALETEKSHAALMRVRMKALQAEYEAAEKEIAAKPGISRERIDKAVQNLRELLATLPPAANPEAEAGPGQPADTAFSNLIISRERLDALNRFLSTYDEVVAGKGASEGSSRVAIALALFPDLLARSREALAEADKPKLVAVVLRKNLEQARLEGAQREVQRREAVLELRRAHVGRLKDQAAAYRSALRAWPRIISALKGPDTLASALQPYAEGTDKKTRDAKLEAWRSSTLYLEAEGRMRADVGKTRYRINALEHEAVLSRAETSIQQWKGLIDPSVELIGTWGASGTKSEDVVQLFNSLTLLGIAVGVN